MTAGWEMWAWPAVMAAGDGELERLRCSWDQAVPALSPGRSSQPVNSCRASPTKRMSAVEQGGSAAQHRASRPDLGECGSSDAGECDFPCGSGRAEGLGVVGSVQIGDKGGCRR